MTDGVHGALTGGARGALTGGARGALTGGTLPVTGFRFAGMPRVRFILDPNGLLIRVNLLIRLICLLDSVPGRDSNAKEY
jgi:hypothetical protein